jgi:hypothetical protein
MPAFLILNFNLFLNCSSKDRSIHVSDSAESVSWVPIAVVDVVIFCLVVVGSEIGEGDDLLVIHKMKERLYYND